MKDLISVIIPVYKAEPYLRRCVDSVLAQTYTNLEIILVDDGSPDNCGVICDEYAEEDCRVKVIHQENSGVSAARNAGIDIACGKFLSFVDADDYIDKTMYKELHHVATHTNAEIVECNYRYGKWDNDDTGNVYLYDGVQAIKKMFMEDRFGAGVSVSPCTKIYYSTVITQVRFLVNCSSAEDTLFVTEALGRAKTVAKLDKSFYNYYLSGDSATRSIYSLRRCDEIVANRCVLDVVEKLGEEELVLYLKNRYASLVVYHWIQCYDRRCQKQFAAKADSLWKQFRQDYANLKSKMEICARAKYLLFWLFPKFYYYLYRIYTKTKGSTIWLA